MLVVRRVVDAGRQQHDGRIVDALRRQPPEVVEQLVTVAVHGPHVISLEKLGEDALQHLPVAQEVGDTGRSAQVVFQDAVPAIPVAHQVDACNLAVQTPGNGQPDQLAQETRR